MVDLLTCHKSIKVQIYRTAQNCRVYLPEGPVTSLEIHFPRTYDPYNVCSRDQDPHLDNGITIGNPKIFDTFALRKLLTITANQLASINPINAAQITNAYGTLQGVERDVSYMSLQVTQPLVRIRQRIR